MQGFCITNLGDFLAWYLITSTVVLLLLLWDLSTSSTTGIDTMSYSGTKERSKLRASRVFTFTCSPNMLSSSSSYNKANLWPFHTCHLESSLLTAGWLIFILIFEGRKRALTFCVKTSVCPLSSISSSSTSVTLVPAKKGKHMTSMFFDSGCSCLEGFQNYQRGDAKFFVHVSDCDETNSYSLWLWECDCI